MTFGPLVSGEQLQAIGADARVVDVRWYADGRSAEAAYRAGHIPGAVRLDVDTDLSAAASARAGRHPLPSPEQFAAALGRVGVPAGTPVVAYDDAGGSVAARLWWLLHVLEEPVAVLDGGLAAWPGALTSDVPDVQLVERAPRPWPADRFVSAAQVAEARDAAVFDARAADRFAGAPNPLDPRPGHIPGAVSAPWAGNLRADGRFLDPSQLRTRFAAAAGRPVIAYCGSGVTACHDLLALQLAGFDDAALFAGSWSQWSADPARPANLHPDETPGSARLPGSPHPRT